MARIFQVILIMRRVKKQEVKKERIEVGEGNNWMATTMSEWVEKEKRERELRERRNRWLADKKGNFLHSSSNE